MEHISDLKTGRLDTTPYQSRSRHPELKRGKKTPHYSLQHRLGVGDPRSTYPNTYPEIPPANNCKRGRDQVASRAAPYLRFSCLTVVSTSRIIPASCGGGRQRKCYRTALPRSECPCAPDVTSRAEGRNRFYGLVRYNNSLLKTRSFP
ncbi:hypothetical protein EVAR_21656_1 [Eumeta japonica]|uniref:Uncharacterized protein n=1 Tax=Eumeta variegata TaxID=151549 RepID=A0A4C1VGQ4_EUMVA|nr:hypothetical protein EVAR_21656_1 [Eumeta japonica]